jgi:hypothetical protein
VLTPGTPTNDGLVAEFAPLNSAGPIVGFDTDGAPYIPDPGVLPATYVHLNVDSDDTPYMVSVPELLFDTDSRPYVTI